MIKCSTFKILLFYLIPFKWKAAIRMYDWIHSVSSDDWSLAKEQILLHTNVWYRMKERRNKRRRRLRRLRRLKEIIIRRQKKTNQQREEMDRERRRNAANIICDCVCVCGGGCVSVCAHRLFTLEYAGHALDMYIRVYVVCAVRTTGVASTRTMTYRKIRTRRHTNTKVHVQNYRDECARVCPCVLWTPCQDRMRVNMV